MTSKKAKIFYGAFGARLRRGPSARPGLRPPLAITCATSGTRGEHGRPGLPEDYTPRNRPTAKPHLGHRRARRACNNRGGLFSGIRMHGLCLDPRLNGPYCSRTSTRFAATSLARACPGAMLMSSITSRVSAFETLRSQPRSETAFSSSWLPSTRTTSQCNPCARNSRTHAGRTTFVSPGWRAKRLLNEARRS